MTLIEAARTTLRRQYDSPRTEEAYIYWIRESVRFHHRRHPRTMDAPEVAAFLNHLATERRTSAPTQNQALCAVVFLYERVPELDMPRLQEIQPARRPELLPTVLGRRDVLALLDRLEPPFRLMGEIFYGSGLRVDRGPLGVISPLDRLALQDVKHPCPNRSTSPAMHIQPKIAPSRALRQGPSQLANRQGSNGRAHWPLAMADLPKETPACRVGIEPISIDSGWVGARALAVRAAAGCEVRRAPQRAVIRALVRPRRRRGAATPAFRGSLSLRISCRRSAPARPASVDVAEEMGRGAALAAVDAREYVDDSREYFDGRRTVHQRRANGARL